MGLSVVSRDLPRDICGPYDDLDGVGRAMDALLRREDVARMLPQQDARAS